MKIVGSLIYLAMTLLGLVTTPLFYIIGMVWGLVFPFMAPLIDLVATRARPLAMIFVVLPASFVMRNYLGVREYIFQTFFADPKAHDERVSRVVGDVTRRLARPKDQRRKMCTARAPWQNLSTRFADYKSNSDCIFVGDFRNILQLNEEVMTVRIEPLVEVGQITRYLLPRGYMLKTTLEIEEATVGGLAMAVGMTTASHKYGLLQETVVEYEVVMGDGKLVKARKDNEHADLWHALPWSHGSLGLLVALTLEICPTKPWVALSYQAVEGHKQICQRIREVSLAEDPADFVEATLFTKDQGVVMEASFVDAPTSSAMVNNCNWWFKPWFYCHIRDMYHRGRAQLLDNNAPITEFIPTYQYIFRHNRAVFWSLNDQLPESIGNHWLFRLCLGWLAPPKVTFLKLPATPKIRHEMMLQRVYQDIVLPISALEDSVLKADELFDIWPILVYPSRIYDHGATQGQFRKPIEKVAGKDYGMFYDLGVYGIPGPVRAGESDKYKPVTCMREMEHFTRNAGGAPFLYADTFMTRDEFGEMFDLSLYERTRQKYGAEEHFPHLYDKTSGCQSFDWRKLLEEESATKKTE